MTDNSVELKLREDFDLNSLPSEGKVSFIVEVTVSGEGNTLESDILTWLRLRKFLIAP